MDTVRPAPPAAGDLASQISPPKSEQPQPRSPSQRARETDLRTPQLVQPFPQLAQSPHHPGLAGASPVALDFAQVGLSAAKSASRHSSRPYRPADGDSVMTSPAPLPTGSPSLLLAKVGSDPPGSMRKGTPGTRRSGAQSQFSSSLSESAIQSALHQARPRKGRGEGPASEQGQPQQEWEDDEDEVTQRLTHSLSSTPADPADLIEDPRGDDMRGVGRVGGPIYEGDSREEGEEEALSVDDEERTGISLLDATDAAARAAQVHLAMTEQVADTSSYQAALRLLDKKDPKAEITSVPKALKILQVSADLHFDEGINACLRYLEAVPWSGDEEAEVLCVLRKLGLDNTKAGMRVLARLAPSSSDSVYSVMKKLLAQAVAPPSDESMAAALSVGAAISAGVGRTSAAGSSDEGGHVFRGSGEEGPKAPLLSSIAGSKRMWRSSVEKLFMGAKLKADVRKRVLFEQLDALIDRVQACVALEPASSACSLENGSSSSSMGLTLACPSPGFGPGAPHSHLASPGQAHGTPLISMADPLAAEAVARFRVEMDNLAWLMGTMVDKLGFAEYIVKWLSEDAGFVKNVEVYSHRDNPIEASMYDPLLPILLRLLTLMVGGHVLIPTMTRYALIKRWLPVLSGIPALPRTLGHERGKRFGDLLGQVIVTLPMAQQEEVLDLWLSCSRGRYNTWLDMGMFLEGWLEGASKKMVER